MKYSVSRALGLILFCLALNINSAAAKKPVLHKKIDIKSQKSAAIPYTKTIANDVISETELESTVLQAIKDEFTAKEVIGEIPNILPKILMDEFNAKKQSIIDNLTKKNASTKTIFISGSDITSQVQQTFKSFINRVKFYHIHEWTQTVVANIKKNKIKGKNSSSAKVDSSLKNFAKNPPYLNTDGSLNL